MNELEKYRDEITAIDGEMAELFEKRMSAVHKVADYKKERGLPVLDSAREAQIIEKNLAGISDGELKDYYVSFLRNTIELSKKYQAQLINGKNGAAFGDKERSARVGSDAGRGVQEICQGILCGIRAALQKCAQSVREKRLNRLTALFIMIMFCGRGETYLVNILY